MKSPHPKAIRAALGLTDPRQPAIAPQSEAEIKRACMAWLTLNNYRPIRVQSGRIFGSYEAKAGGKRPWVFNCAPAGTADVLVVLPPRGYALWIEFKGPNGVQKPEQVEFAEWCAKVGAGYRLIRSLDQLIVAMREERLDAATHAPEGA